MILGIQSANGEYPCPWCTNCKSKFTCNTHEINRKYKNQTIGITGFKNESILPNQTVFNESSMNINESLIF